MLLAKTLYVPFPAFLPSEISSHSQDVLVYEAPLLRNITNSKGPLTITSGADIRESLQLPRSSFIDFALLLGTDFSQRIKNVGPSRAFKFIKEYGSIEAILEAETKFPPRSPVEMYLKEVAAARAVFLSLPEVPDKALMMPGVRDDQKVEGLLYDYGLGWALKDVNKWDEFTE